MESQNIRSTETSFSSRGSKYYNGVGSQACSCYQSKNANILQFELSNDEVTRQASSNNGAGPKSCEDLKDLGYTFDGFYMVKFKTNIIKTVYCVFHYREEDEYNPQGSPQSTLKPISKFNINTYL